MKENRVIASVLTPLESIFRYPKKVIKTLSSLLVLIHLFISSSFAVETNKASSHFKVDRLKIEAPDFIFENETAKEFRLSAFRGKNIVVHFWASWCKPCQKELPQIVSQFKALSKNEFVFLPISAEPKDKKKEIDLFLKDLSPSVSTYQVSEKSNLKSYLAWGLPVTYFINAKGIIVARAVGTRDWSTLTSDELSGFFK